MLLSTENTTRFRRQAEACGDLGPHTLTAEAKVFSETSIFSLNPATNSGLVCEHRMHAIAKLVSQFSSD